MKNKKYKQQRYIINNYSFTFQKLMKAFQKKYSLQERIQKSQKQISQNPGKIPIIAQPHSKSKLPALTNTKFLCEQHYKFNAVCSILAKKIDKVRSKPNSEGTIALFIYVNNNLINREQTIANIYNKYKDKDGFLYITYGQMQGFG